MAEEQGGGQRVHTRLNLVADDLLEMRRPGERARTGIGHLVVSDAAKSGRELSLAGGSRAYSEPLAYSAALFACYPLSPLGQILASAAPHSLSPYAPSSPGSLGPGLAWRQGHVLSRAPWGRRRLPCTYLPIPRLAQGA